MNNRQNNAWNQNPNMVNGNVPGNQIPYQQQQFQNNQYIPPKAPRQKRKKRKKKHRFLKFLLFCVLIFLGYKGSSILLNNMAEKEMSQFVVDYPFIFEEETDCLWYITHNFSVPSTYELEGKTYDVEWDTNNTMINVDESGYATVTRPDNYSIVVQLTETYKKLWGKATREYELTLIPSSSISVEDVNVISLDALKDGSYHKEMQAVSDENGNLKYMLGEFKDTYVNSSEDAQVILQAYKNQFNITDENITFKYISNSKSPQYLIYKFDLYYNDLRISNCSAQVSVNYKDNSVKKVSIDTTGLNGFEIQEEALPDEQIAEILESYMRDSIETEFYAIINKTDVIKENKRIRVYEVTTSDKSSYKIIIDLTTGEVLECVDTAEDSEIHEIEIAEESIKGSSQTERGENITFDATRLEKLSIEFWKKPYILKDLGRNIHAVDNEGWWALYREAEKAQAKEDQNFFDLLKMIGGLVDYYIELQLTSEISSKTPEFEDKIAAQSYKNFQTVYDWYKDTYGLISYDGKGSEVLVRMHCKNTYNNASWDGSNKSFKINPVTKYKYSLGIHGEVIGHEFTHAVFGSASLSLGSDAPIMELKGMNEAYADIMGCLITNSSDWIMGDNFDLEGNRIIVRDIKNMNNDACKNKFPETYKGENWIEEEHAMSVVLSHVAWEMYNCGLFSNKDIADIWYNSLYLGYDNSSTFVTCRKYIIQTADDLGYSDEQIDFIANAFDEREIFDESYEFRTDKYKNPEEQTSDSSETIKTKKESVSGDPLLDDTNNHRFLVAYSVLQMLFEGDGIYIYEEANTMTKDEQAQFEKLLNQKVEECYGIESLSGNKIKITYKQIPGWQIDWLDKICGESISYIKGRTFDILDQNGSDEDTEIIKGWFNKLLRFAFDWEIKESTAYDLYDELGLIQ